MSEPDETHLLARIVLRDREAFAQFYELTSPRVYALALKMLGQRGLAADLLQDVYLKVWYGADAYDAGRGEPLAWLITITRHRAIDMLRSKSLREESLQAPLETVTGSADPADKQLDDCVQRLEDQQRQSIFAAFFLGLTHSEIARRFAEPVGTIKSRVRRGLLALRECLES